ncbi:hypothetical protein HanLR1_Chr10g0372291 [Helianthus annuus]|nr:hypothetical protein HanLR1_Chr10g0372291 [Helianthus annuus]
MNPDEVTLVVSLSACGQIRALESGRWIHSYIQNNGVYLNVQGARVCCGGQEPPELRKDYMMLEEVNRWLKDHGYIPQTDVALHDLGEKERARSLEVHSEKLATVFV